MWSYHICHTVCCGPQNNGIVSQVYFGNTLIYLSKRERKKGLSINGVSLKRTFLFTTGYLNFKGNLLWNEKYHISVEWRRNKEGGRKGKWREGERKGRKRSTCRQGDPERNRKREKDLTTVSYLLEYT